MQSDQAQQPPPSPAGEMYPQSQHNYQSHPRGVVYGTLFRINLWAKMTTALGVTQIVIGFGCIVLYLIACFLDLSSGQLLKYLGLGIASGAVILAAGILGLAASKRRTKTMIMLFLILSSMAVICATFPMVLGIIGAKASFAEEIQMNPDGSIKEEEGDTLLMPICQLVFATVEIVVAAWSIGVCCQALYCPNATFGQVGRYPASTGVAISQLVSSGDSQHLVLFTSAHNQPFMYSVTAGSPQPIIVHNGDTFSPFMPPSTGDRPSVLVTPGTIPPLPPKTKQVHEGRLLESDMHGTREQGSETPTQSKDEDEADTEEKEDIGETTKMIPPGKENDAPENAAGGEVKGNTAAPPASANQGEHEFEHGDDEKALLLS